MFKILKDLFLKCFIQKIYRENKEFYFPIFSHAPKYLNLAYPDFSIQYFILSLGTGDFVTLDGVIPRDKIVFWSVCLYDDKAMPIWSKNDSHFKTNRYIIPVHATKPVALIVRFYVKTKYQNNDFYQYLPNISPPRPSLTKARRQQITHSLFVQMKKRISKHFKTIDPTILNKHEFFLPGSKRRQALFSNPFAFYLAMFPKNKDSVFTISINTKNLEQLRFIGFMSCNYETTETRESISLEKKKQYTIYVCHEQKRKKLQNKYPSAKHILCFSTHPIIIYRLVIVNKQHPFLKLNEKEEDTYFPKIQQKLKEYYPKVQCLNDL